MSHRNSIVNVALTSLLGGVAVSALALPSAQTAFAAEAPTIKHVLLISVDGLHEVDLANYVKAHPASALAKLSDRSITYTKAVSSRPSDSFPGLLAMITGGTPRSTGVYYDNSYDRKLSPPGSDCSTVGTEVVYDETINIDPDKLDGAEALTQKNCLLTLAKDAPPSILIRSCESILSLK